MEDKMSLEQSLVEEKLISAEQMQMLKMEQQRSGVTLTKAVRRLKLISEDALFDFLSKKLRIDRFSLSGFSPDSAALALLPPEFAWRERVLPLAKKNDELSVGILDPLDTPVLEELRFRTGLFIKPYLVKEEELNSFLSQNYDRRRGRAASAPALSKVSDDRIMAEVNKPSVVEAVDLLLIQAARVNASDIHIEPLEGRIGLRLRVDGVLKEVSSPDSSIFDAFISRIKIMSNLDIAEKRIAQDGRFKVELEEAPLDVRVSVLPTVQGESIVLRLLKQHKNVLTMQELGMPKDHLETYARLIQRPSGIILVTGPTGSGKTTTLYASLSTLKAVERNIITIEDPVEYQLDFCRQIQVNPKVNMTFAAGLRSILRHDPDIIMVGEIRDLETATIAIQAALTGHLVFSTLHTNDAASAITRLIDMGIEPFLIASCLNGAVAQRLVRMLCPKCKKEERAVFKNSPYPDKEQRVYQAQGCQDCLNTGFAGRIGIFEIMEMDSQISRLTVEKASSDEIIKTCRLKGMRFLYDDGWQKVSEGLTSPQELIRVLGAG